MAEAPRTRTGEAAGAVRGAGGAAGRFVRRVGSASRTLSAERRLAALAALTLVATMFLPWYGKSVFDPRTQTYPSDNVSAFGAVTFVEAAVFLVALAVLVLLFLRAEGARFELPFGDGGVIFAGGIWAALLIFWRVFDRPDLEARGATVGLQWGIFLAFVAAAALATAGWRIRVARGARGPGSGPSAAEPPATGPSPAPAPSPSDAPASAVPPSEAPASAASLAKRPPPPAEATTTAAPASQAPTRVPPHDDIVPADDEPDEEPLRPGEIPSARRRR